MRSVTPDIMIQHTSAKHTGLARSSSFLRASAGVVYVTVPVGYSAAVCTQSAQIIDVISTVEIP